MDIPAIQMGEMRRCLREGECVAFDEGGQVPPAADRLTLRTRRRLSTMLWHVNMDQDAVTIGQWDECHVRVQVRNPPGCLLLEVSMLAPGGGRVIGQWALQLPN